jgi:hypothetical protein
MINQRIAMFLSLIKWPVALVAIFFLPALAIELWNILLQFILNINEYYAVGMGMIVYYALWKLLLEQSNISWLSTLEHEITHCLFAWLTFNKVTNIHVTLTSGGHINHEGYSNWLISIAPYFFPTLTFSLFIIQSWIGTNDPFIFQFFIGWSMTYHLLSTWEETHPNQTDLRNVGFLFSWLFLPSMNLLSYIFVFNFILNKEMGFSTLFHSILNHQMFFISFLKNSI